ncbi:hypothetical protein EVJ58_g3833 [Rhodofomes roseus]|uniref:Zn(2)-C6 fungal-type domain-containing protein n=1 Tax=Rhodofomes roseus TaxID=34475 RepID=A0A4Y9YIW9_9APHY|nr:hypothetical protein EVJ58_g3833 [Rhodofomes roseus]
MPSTTSATPSPHTGSLYLPPTARRSRAAAAGLHLIFDSASDRNSDSCADSPSSYSDASFSSVSSSGPATPLSRPSSPVVVAPAGENADGEDCWNLIPYHVPWGNEYCDYKPGSLPGPDGNCFFLRSPTPLKYKRTCSGDRPACNRCVSRGYICQYDPEEPKRTKGPELARQRLRERSDRNVSVSNATASGAAVPSSLSIPPLVPAASSPSHFFPKREEVEMLPELGELSYPITEGDVEPWPALHSQMSELTTFDGSSATQNASARHHFAQPMGSPESTNSLLLQHDQSSQGYALSNLPVNDQWSYAAHSPAEQLNVAVPLASSVYAPRPVRRSQVSFLAETQRVQPPPAAPPPITIPQPPILQPTLVPVAEPEFEPAHVPAPQPMWPNDVQVDAYVTQSAQELINGYVTYDYAPATATYNYAYPPPQEYMPQAYYDMSMYGQDVGVAPAATYVSYAV